MKESILISKVILVLIISLLCGCERTTFNDDTKNSVVADYHNIYEITEVLNEELYEEYIKDEEALFYRLLNFKHQLDNSPEFEFYSFANNFVEVINSEVAEKCVVNYGTEFATDSKYEIANESIIAAEAIQISENFFTLFPLKISKGRNFNSLDFDRQNSDSIPVILGQSYCDYYSLDDTFEGYYIGERKTFNVIGFTDIESVFYSRSNNSMTSYQNYIIMPFENIEEDSYYSRAILLQQICGFIKPHDGRDHCLQTISEYLIATNLEKWSEAIVVNKKSLQNKMNY